MVIICGGQYKKTDEEFDSITDLQLCHIVSRYLKLTGQKGEIVFDGTGPPDKIRFDNINNLEISFAGLATDADTVIEDKIRANTDPKKIDGCQQRPKAACRGTDEKSCCCKIRSLLGKSPEADESAQSNQRAGGQTLGT